MSKAIESGTGQTSSVWIGPGTWLVDRRHHRPTVGVITQVHERDREMGARLAIRWRPNRYQNVSLAIAIEYLRTGDWAIDPEVRR